jgi:hypothetical protein
MDGDSLQMVEGELAQSSMPTPLPSEAVEPRVRLIRYP